MREELLFYDEYERFYTMASASEAFSAFCSDAYGRDFSQDGFSDAAQIDQLLIRFPRKTGMHILDIGCGNGKMLRYIQQRTGAAIHGFDFSENAIRSAAAMSCPDADFRTGVIGQIDYPAGSFDAVISMDSMYFAPDMTAFVSQIRRWMKQDGMFCIGYQEGDIMPRTQGPHDTVLARALQANRMHYEAEDITGATYTLMQRKRAAALRHQAALIREGCGSWFDMLMAQTEHAMTDEETYCRENARYLYTARKEQRSKGKEGKE